MKGITARKVVAAVCGTKSREPGIANQLSGRQTQIPALAIRKCKVIDRATEHLLQVFARANHLVGKCIAVGHGTETGMCPRVCTNVDAQFNHRLKLGNAIWLQRLATCYVMRKRLVLENKLRRHEVGDGNLS